MKKLLKYDYAYTCQGDKKLTTELLLRNRLNYLDSWWLGGNYTSNKVVGEIFIRANANQNGTSDTFLDSATYDNSVENLSAAARNRGFSLLDYNENNSLDAKAGYQITPFLH